MSTQTSGAVPAFTVADRLRKAREHAGLDQGGLALRMGVSRNTVSNNEGGKVSPARMIRSRPAGWLFPGNDNGHISPGHLGRIVSAALPEGLAMHSLRHRCGTVSYAGTRDLRAVQELLGHATVTTTQIYTAVPDGAVRAAVLAAAA